MKGAFAVLLLLAWVPAQAAGEYKGKYLYAQTDPADKGGIRIILPQECPKFIRAVAWGRKRQQPYLGAVAHERKLVVFSNLPVDKYDLLLVTADTVYEGLELVHRSKAELVEVESDSITVEIRKIEAFFEGKRVERVGVNEELKSVALVQQWRIGRALAESGAVLTGTIHSIDLFFFEKPHKGWQLVKRRQLFREEMPLKSAFRRVSLKQLSGIRVLSKQKVLTLKIPQTAAAK